MISGIHAVIYARQPTEVRAFFRDVLRLSSVDAGGGWPIFALPPAELGIHPTDAAESSELFLVCDDLDVAIAEFKARGISTSGPVQEVNWGRLVELVVTDTFRIGMYQPGHPSATSESISSPGPS